MPVDDEAKEKSDPLVYMNQLTRWPDPPPMSARWFGKLAEACRMIAERDDRITTLTEENAAYEGMKDGFAIRIADAEAMIALINTEKETQRINAEQRTQQLMQARKEIATLTEQLRVARDDNARLAGVVEAGKQGWAATIKENNRLRDWIQNNTGYCIARAALKEKPNA